MAGLFRRLKNVLNAEVHDMLDEHESPDRIARQLVRESTDKAEIAQKLTIEAIASEKQLAHQLNEHTGSLKKNQEAAELALQNGDEVGARRAIESRLHHQKLLDTLTPQLQQAETNSANLKKQLTSLQQQLNSLKSERLAIEARYNAAKATGKIEAMTTEVQMSDDTMSRLQRANEMVTAMETRNEAVAEVSMVTNPCSATDYSSAIDSEMQKLRDQLGNQ